MLNPYLEQLKRALYFQGLSNGNLLLAPPRDDDRQRESESNSGSRASRRDAAAPHAIGAAVNRELSALDAHAKNRHIRLSERTNSR